MCRFVTEYTWLIIVCNPYFCLPCCENEFLIKTRKLSLKITSVDHVQQQHQEQWMQLQSSKNKKGERNCKKKNVVSCLSWDPLEIETVDEHERRWKLLQNESFFSPFFLHTWRIKDVRVRWVSYIVFLIREEQSVKRFWREKVLWERDQQQVNKRKLLSNCLLQYFASGIIAHFLKDFQKERLLILKWIKWRWKWLDVRRTCMKQAN